MKAMKLSVLSLLTLVVLAQAAAPVMAKPFRPCNNNNSYNNGYHNNYNQRYDQRGYFQRTNDRISRNFVNGQLTRNEARQLQRGENRIWQAQRIAQADGYVSPQEARRLADMRSRQNWQLYRESNDRQTRY
jgi:hypothetical protein